MMKEKIGYPDYILNATALQVEYNNIQLNQSVFLGELFFLGAKLLYNYNSLST